MRFPGQIYDSQAGLQQNYYRDYDPAIGRYVESDPIGLKGDSYSTYTYAGGIHSASRAHLDYAPQPINSVLGPSMRFTPAFTKPWGIPWVHLDQVVCLRALLSFLRTFHWTRKLQEPRPITVTMYMGSTPRLEA